MVAHQSVQLLGNVFLRFVVVVSPTIVTSPLQLRISSSSTAPRSSTLPWRLSLRPLLPCWLALMSAQVQLLRLDLRLQVIDPSFPRVFAHSWRAEGRDRARRGSKDSYRITRLCSSLACFCTRLQENRPLYAE